MPNPQICKKSNRKTEEKYFILTSAEAYAAKLKQKEEKEKLEHEKKIRMEKRNEKKNTNKENVKKPVKKNTTNANKTTTVPTTVSDAHTVSDDTTACMYCEIRYCDSCVTWHQCKICNQWACANCSNMGRPKKRKIFVCDTCK
jgi:ATP-dependent 26S proteasome regulatory subunit